MVIVVLAIVVVLAVAMLAEREEEEPEPGALDSTDSQRVIDALGDEDYAIAENASRRMLALGPSSLRPVFDRLRLSDPADLPPDAQLRFEATVRDFGLSGVDRLESRLADVSRGQATFPAIVRISAPLGEVLLDHWARGKPRLAPAVVAQVLRTIGRDDPERWAPWCGRVALLDLVLAPLLDHRHNADIPPPVVPALSLLPGGMRELAVAQALSGDLGGTLLAPERLARDGEGGLDPLQFDIVAAANPDLRRSSRGIAAGWGAAVDGAERHTLAWVRAAAERIADPPVHEAMLQLAMSSADAAWPALAVLAVREPETALEVLVASKRRGWPEGSSAWLRTVVRSIGGAAVRPLFELAVARGPRSIQDVGDTFADVDVGTVAAEFASASPRSRGWFSVFIEAVVACNADQVRPALMSTIEGSDRRARRGAIELVGRHGWIEAAPRLVELANENPSDASLCAVAIELMGPSALTTLAGVPYRSDAVARAVALIERVGEAQRG